MYNENNRSRGPLIYDDFSHQHPGWNLFLSHQQTKEVISPVLSITDLGNAVPIR
jgi:hypothetical protein